MYTLDKDSALFADKIVSAPCCLNIFKYIRLFTNVYVTDVVRYIYVYIFMHSFGNIHMYLYMYTDVRIQIYASVHKQIDLHPYISTHLYIHKNAYD